MNNQEYASYIHQKLSKHLQNVRLIRSETENQPNNNFVIIFDINNIQISFVKDRGYLNGEILQKGNYVPYWKLDKSLQNIWLESTDDIDLIINFLVKNKDDIFKEE